jgi:Protein of unknown function (DUF1329)
MKKLAVLTVCWAAVLIATRAPAAVTAQEADHLGKDLTAVGAEKAGNADGTIPAFEGANTPLPGWEWGKLRSQYSKFKDEKPLFSIDASNVDKYASQLPDGQITALKTVKGYRMDVYPSHRTCGITPVHAERTKANATEARIGPDGWSLEHARTAGVPFPIPKSGVEVMYNVRMRPADVGVIYHDGTSVISPRSGTHEFTWYQWILYFYYPFQRPEKPSVEADGNVEFFVYYNFSKPPALAGQGFVATNWMNKDPESYYYFPGQRRVRRLPSYIFDTPLIGYENQYMIDEQIMLWSTLDRFDYKLLGKKEMYVGYNQFKTYDYSADPKVIFQESYVNPDYRRYELHRVWVVDARIKPRYRHLAQHRIYYVDEDSWGAVALTDYDKDEKVWKNVESFLIPAWEIGGTCVYSPTEMWDLQNGRYVFDYMSIGGGKDIKWIKETDPEAKQAWLKSDFYTPETLRALSER